ncbi:hypothetical protein SteCoe_11629 [Stentor coeruleus]|uniref:Ubiquitin-like domain-containing protein n=1 Tax=Stentor coeruleus TaxID=5963 RepID=A0A1R2CCR3_9CILI|nr:hypothetical protein SteCoe_11629 [Stentor coeruleus]
MGCSESMNSELKLTVDLNTPIFKTSQIKHSAMIRTSLKDFCTQIVSSNVNSEYRESCKNYKVTCKGITYAINENISLYDLRLTEKDTISISGSINEPKKIEVTLKICYPRPKEISLKVSRNSLVKDLLEEDSNFRFIRSDIQLDMNEKLENYDIGNKSRVIVLVGDNPCEDVQKWRIKKTGLILEACCMNNNCVAYKQRVSLSLGLGDFDIVNEMSCENYHSCTCCNSLLSKAIKFGYCHCQVSYCEFQSDGIPVEVVNSTKDFLEGVLPVGLESFVVKLSPLI